MFWGTATLEHLIEENQKHVIMALKTSMATGVAVNWVINTFRYRENETFCYMKAPQEHVLLDLAESQAAGNQSVFTFTNRFCSKARRDARWDCDTSYTVKLSDSSCSLPFGFSFFFFFSLFYVFRIIYFLIASDWGEILPSWNRSELLLQVCCTSSLSHPSG